MDSKENKQTHIALPGGAKMPIVGLGTWKADKGGVVQKAVYDAIKAGYMHLDCASTYGNEAEVGAGIKQALDDKLITRDKLFVTSKVWNVYHAKEHVIEACKRSLKDLGLTYLDLYLIHFPISLKFIPFEECYPTEWTHPEDNKIHLADVPIQETWSAMEELVRLGLVKNIGVSNFCCQLLMDVLKYAKVPVSVNQIEYHPYLGPQHSLVKFCQSRGVAVTGYSSFGPQSYVSLSEAAKQMQPLLSHPSVMKVAKKHNKSASQVLLRWATQRDIMVIPKSTDVERLKQNLHIFNFTLDDVDYIVLDGLARGLRLNDPGVYAGIPIFD